jgi:hypothetical protein
MENRNGLIVDALPTRASGHAERLAVIALIEPRAERPNPITLGTDKAYDTGDLVMELRDLCWGMRCRNPIRRICANGLSRRLKRGRAVMRRSLSGSA